MKRFILILLLTPLTIFAIESKSLADHMNGMLKHLIALGNYFDNTAKLYDSSNRATLIKHAKGLKSEFEKAAHDKMLATDSLAPSVEILKEDLTSLISALESKNVNYAKMQFGELRSICLSCHTQLNWETSPQVLDTVSEMSTGAFLSAEDKGDVYSVIRNYAKSSQYYQAALQGSSLQYSQLDEMRILRKILHNFLTGMVDIKAAISFMGTNLGTFKLAKNSMDVASAWVDELEVWNNKFPQFQTTSLSSFLSFYKTRTQAVGDGYDGAREVISYLILGKAGKALVEDNPNYSRAELLFYLGQADEVVDDNILYNLSDHYYKKCIREYPQSPFAKKCLSNYEESVYRGFSGSGGVFIPKEVKEELKSLKALIK